MAYLHGYGVADLGGCTMTPQTPMVIGSVSKSFTALAVMQLVEAGQLDLDAPVQRYLTWFQVADPGAAASITLRHLLTHASGLSRRAGIAHMTERDNSALALEQTVRMLSSEQLDRPVGSSFEYSNANYAVLGLVVQAVSGQSYEEYVQQHIFNPLQMQHSYVAQTEAAQNGMATGYRQWFGFPFAARDLPYPRGMIPAGYLISSAEDLAHYLIAQSSQGHYGDAALLSPQGMAALHSPLIAAAPEGYHHQPSGSYGMGWYVMELNGLSVIAHDGDTPSYHADLIIMPAGKSSDQAWGIAVLMNTNTVLMGDRIRNLAAGVASLVAGQAPPAPVTDYGALSLYVGMSGLLLFEAYNLVRVALTWHRLPAASSPDRGPWLWFKRLVLPLLVGAAVACGAFVIMPAIFQAPPVVMLLNQPDLSWVIFLAGALALLNGVIRFGSNALALRRLDAARAPFSKSPEKSF